GDARRADADVRRPPPARARECALAMAPRRPQRWLSPLVARPLRPGRRGAGAHLRVAAPAPVAARTPLGCPTGGCAGAALRGIFARVLSLPFPEPAGSRGLVLWPRHPQRIRWLARGCAMGPLHRGTDLHSRRRSARPFPARTLERRGGAT